MPSHWLQPVVVDFGKWKRPIKILYLSEAIIPSRSANSIHIMKMCQALARLGNEVKLVAPDRKRKYEKDVKDIFDFYGVNKCFEIIKLPWHYISGKALLYGFLSKQFIKKYRPDLVYARFLLGAYLSAAGNFRTVYESHSPPCATGIIHKYIFRRLIKTKGLIKTVVISEKLRQYYFYNYDIPHEQIITVPDAAEEIPNSIKLKKLRSNNNNLNVGYVGQLYSGRGIQIIDDLAKRCEDINFHIIGGTEEDINKWKDIMGDYKNVEFYGFVPHSETPGYLKAFDLLIAPYLNKVTVYGGKGNTVEWMSPLKIFEYMAAGKAIISSDLNVLKEILKNKENALLCDPERIEDWFNAVYFLRDNKYTRIRLGENAKNDFLKNYTWKIRAKRILSGS